VLALVGGKTRAACDIDTLGVPTVVVTESEQARQWVAGATARCCGVIVDADVEPPAPAKQATPLAVVREVTWVPRLVLSTDPSAELLLRVYELGARFHDCNGSPCVVHAFARWSFERWSRVVGEIDGDARIEAEVRRLAADAFAASRRRRKGKVGRVSEAVFWAVLEGESRRRIRARLGISTSTLQYHVRRLIDALGADSLEQAIERLHREAARSVLGESLPPPREP